MLLVTKSLRSRKRLRRKRDTRRKSAGTDRIVRSSGVDDSIQHKSDPPLPSFRYDLPNRSPSTGHSLLQHIPLHHAPPRPRVATSIRFNSLLNFILFRQEPARAAQVKATGFHHFRYQRHTLLPLDRQICHLLTIDDPNTFPSTDKHLVGSRQTGSS